MDEQFQDELDAWEPETPPADFAERVGARVVTERRAHRRRVAIMGSVAALAVAAAAAVFVLRQDKETSGDITADHEMEIAIGPRAVAVLDAGAHVSWRGSEVTQDRGGVFYRVERGAPFRVHTPAADATVHGTCFGVAIENPEEDMHARDWKAAGVGAAITTVAFVAVYEGKVAVAKGAQSVELTAGQSARAGDDGVKRTGDFDPTSPSGAGTDEPYAKANKNLADQIADYQRRLDALEAQKKSLAARLSEAQDKLTATSDGSAPVAKNPFDLSRDDWKQLAEDGTIKYAIPCSSSPNGYTPPKDVLDKLGLAPQDAAVIHDAYTRSTTRVWDVIRPLCAQAIGGSFQVADRLGADACVHVILDIERQLDGHGVNDAMHDVAEIRAGERQPTDNASPVEQIFLALTSEPTRFESDLAQTLSPDDAHRVVYTRPGINICQNTFGGPGPRKE
ncbi:MAG TPA: hypothetical protein VH054_10665 [Polyangiaceae bacterium]|jgi:ferric-dicitrate binding protein FerR (iron transport regulator)|nr:hypothetical protein [Polyangiaceae bacterium]